MKIKVLTVKEEKEPKGFLKSEFLPPDIPIKYRLKELRKEHKLNQTEAGQIVCTSQKQYSRWETGAYDMPVYELTLYAIYYNKKIDYILGLSNDDNPLYTVEERKKMIESMNMSRYFNRFGMWKEAPSGKDLMDNSQKSNK